MSMAAISAPRYEPLQAHPVNRFPSYTDYREFKSPGVHVAQSPNENDTAFSKNAEYGCKVSASKWSRIKRFLPEWRRQDSVEPILRKGWKPVTLQAPILGGFVFFSIAVIVVLELLSRISAKSSNGGGLAFASDVDNLSNMATFTFLYLPTILSVIYSMLWNWVDLDTKRLEPWFQLSHPDGASGANSLLLQYPFDFLPFIPVTAARKKHWGVFFAGSIMLLVFWAITPLQSAIFNTGTVTRTIETTMADTGRLLSLEAQTSGLNANFLNTGYGISWLNQTLPSFTTANSAMLPFSPANDSGPSSSSEVWTTTTDVYSTNLTCWPAIVTQQTPYPGYTFDNGKGCILSDVVLASTTGTDRYMLNYIGYYNNPVLDWALQNPNCTLEFSNNFLALFATAASRVKSGVYSNLTAIFCEPSYYYMSSSVQVNASSLAVESVRNNDPPLPMSSSLFNTSNFEYIIGTGVPSTDDRSNYPDTSILEQYPRVQDLNVAWPFSQMSGFALALNPMTTDDLASPVVLQSAFERAHKLLFATAFSTLVTSANSDSAGSRPGIRRGQSGSILLVRPIAIVVECAFGLIAILTICLGYVSYCRLSQLASDPASLADIMAKLTKIEDLDKRIPGDGTLTAENLEAAFDGHNFRLKLASSGQASWSYLAIDENRHGPSSRNLEVATRTSKLEATLSPIRPVELGTFAGCVFASIIALAISVLVFMGIWSSEHKGFSLPSNNAVVLSIVENYLPTAFATFLEPAWVILNRFLCLLQPFDDMRRGNACSSRSVEAKYTSLPPQLVLFRALRVRHFLLALVCIVAVSTNGLAVALSALMNENHIEITLPFNSTQRILPFFNGTAIRSDGQITFQDHFYVEMSHLTENTTRPIWVDQNFVYLPFDLDTTRMHSNANTTFAAFRGATTGIGANTTCQKLSSTSGANTVRFVPNNNGTDVEFSTSHVLSNGTRVTCVPQLVANSGDLERVIIQEPFTEGAMALEVMSTMQPAFSNDSTTICASTVVAGWVRVAPASGQGANATRGLNTTFVACMSELLVGEFDILVDAEGHILQSNKTKDASSNTDQYFASNFSQIQLFEQANLLMTPHTTEGFNWHNDSFTSDWMNSLLGYMINSDRLVNPMASVPTTELAASATKSMYQQLFAILIGLNFHVLATSPGGIPLTAGIVVTEPRIFVSAVMTQVCVGILALHLIVAILYYVFRPKRFLPRMPTSIASLILYVSASRALQDYAPEPNESKNRRDNKYGYGRFIDVHGNTRIGIEKQQFVVPLESKNPEARRRRWGLGKVDERQPKTWL
ncbi:hypothetical protein BP5796_10854 [Coleophoma crateriformis]|uniref:Uncharacterized protein n=1 Tax=Coleophoma crateriformis TaxID=565419 RepID=A0A3D8QL75_9HELO|nr:hypothetical protein BP5796_10854 [Coleophoma crateriformis]